MNTFQKFKNQHEQNNPLYIGNVWDVNSATEPSVMQTLGTS